MAHRIEEKQAPQVPLRVLSRGLAKVQDYRSLMEARTNRFVGWRWDGTLGPEFVDALSGETKHHGGHVKKVDEVTEIAADDPHREEYVRHLKDGDLWAADPETAQAAGIAFEPHFLGEHPETMTQHAEAYAKMLNASGWTEKVAGFVEQKKQRAADEEKKQKASEQAASKDAPAAPASRASK
jgi:hypothetical protein